jgi:hypothetical protein
VIVIGGYLNKYGLSVRTSPLQVLSDGSISISGVMYDQQGTAALSLHMVRKNLSSFGRLLYHSTSRIIYT